MAYQNIGVTLGIGGRILPSLPASFNIARQSLRGLQSQIQSTNAALGRMGRGLIGVLGAGAGLAGLASLTSFLQESVKLGKEQENITGNLYILLQNTARMRREDARLAGQQLRVIQAQSRSMQEQSGISETIYTRGAATLLTAGLTTKQIAQMQPMMANLMAYQMRMGKSTEQMAYMYQVIGRAIHTGQARGLNQVGIILSKQEQRIMSINALMGNYAANIEIIRRHMQLFNGDATAFLKTAQGQSALAMTHAQAWMRLIGKAFLPVQQQLTIIFAKMVELFGPYIIQALKNFTVVLQQLNQYLNNNRVAIQAAIKDGWQRLIAAIDWFKANSSWLVPLLIKIGIAFVAWTLVIGPLISALGSLAAIVSAIIVIGGPIAGAFAAIDLPAVALVATITGLVAGLSWLIDNWKKVPFLGGGGAFTPPEVGRQTQPGNPSRNAPGFFSPPEAGFWQRFMQDLQTGWIETTTQLSWFWRQFTSNIEKGWSEMIQQLQWFFSRWINILETGWNKRVAKWWDPMINGIKSVGAAIWKWMITPFEYLNNLWQQFLKSIGWGTGDQAAPGSGSGYPAGGGGGGGGGGNGSGYPASGGDAGRDPGDSRGGMIWNPLGPAPSATVRAGYYGAGVGDRPTRAVTYGPLGHLQYNDLAVSPDLSKVFPLKSYVDVFNKQGKLLLAHQRVADSSWVDAQHPNHRMIETWNRKLKQDEVIIKRSNFQQKKAEDPAPSSPSHGPINITYNVTNHIHGGDEHKIAALHRQHIEKLKDDLEEAMYETHRRKFV
jgi:hypothetical protein